MQGEPLLTGGQHYWRVFMSYGSSSFYEDDVHVVQYIVCKEERILCIITQQTLCNLGWQVIYNLPNLFSFTAHNFIACKPAHTHIGTHKYYNKTGDSQVAKHATIHLNSSVKQVQSLGTSLIKLHTALLSLEYHTWLHKDHKILLFYFLSTTRDRCICKSLFFF